MSIKLFNFKRHKVLAQKEPDKPKEVKDIIREQLEKEVKEYHRDSKELFMSALAAGLEVGFSLFTMGVLYTLYVNYLNPSALHVLLSFGYAIGFIFVIIGRSELFTEHTTLAIMPVLDGSISPKRLFGMWGTVFSGNLLGGYFFAFLLTLIGPKMGIISNDAFYHLGYQMVKYDWKVILGSGIMAGWLMGLLSWLVTSSQETISRIFVVILVTTVIGLGGLHHSIVGSIEVFSGLLSSSKITVMDYSKFQLNATIGNLIGGTVFVAVLKFSLTRFRS